MHITIYINIHIQTYIYTISTYFRWEEESPPVYRCTYIMYLNVFIYAYNHKHIHTDIWVPICGEKRNQPQSPIQGEGWCVHRIHVNTWSEPRCVHYMYLYIYMEIYIYIYIYKWINIYKNEYIYIYIYMNICMHENHTSSIVGILTYHGHFHKQAYTIFIKVLD
jgi:hypothetical protein